MTLPICIRKISSLLPNLVSVMKSNSALFLRRQRDWLLNFNSLSRELFSETRKSHATIRSQNPALLLPSLQSVLNLTEALQDLKSLAQKLQAGMNLGTVANAELDIDEIRTTFDAEAQDVLSLHAELERVQATPPLNAERLLAAWDEYVFLLKNHRSKAEEFDRPLSDCYNDMCVQARNTGLSLTPHIGGVTSKRDLLDLSDFSWRANEQEKYREIRDLIESRLQQEKNDLLNNEERKSTVIKDPDYKTLAEWEFEESISSSVLSKATARKDSHPNYLPHKKIGRHVYIHKNDMRRFIAGFKIRSSKQHRPKRSLQQRLAL